MERLWRNAARTERNKSGRSRPELFARFLALNVLFRCATFR